MKAIILCAGLGSRLSPLTLIKPKPLLEIRGKSILENTIGILKDSGVNDIIVVNGYKAELFTPLVDKLQFRQIIFRDFESCNSAATLQFIIDEITQGSLILNGDLYISKPFIPLFKRGVSQILAQRITQGESWGYICDENCKLLDIDMHANSGYGDGVTFFDNADDIALIKESLIQCSSDEYWESCIYKAMDKVNFYVFKEEHFYTEIDCFYDALHSNLLTPEEIAIQCADDGKIERLKGITNTNYKINFCNQASVIRIPGNHTDMIIDRVQERDIVDLMYKMGITPKAAFYNSDIKISEFLEGYRQLEFEDFKCEANAGRLFYLIITRMKQIHSIKHEDFPLLKPIFLNDEIAKYEKLAQIKLLTPSEHTMLLQIVRNLDKKEFVLCHRDLQLPNIMFNPHIEPYGDIKFLDFEYAGFSSIAWELGNFSAELGLSESEILKILEIYDGEISYREIIEGQFVANYIWALWGWIMDKIDLGRDYLVRMQNNLTYLKKQRQNLK